MIRRDQHADIAPAVRLGQARRDDEPVEVLDGLDLQIGPALMGGFVRRFDVQVHKIVAIEGVQRAVVDGATVLREAIRENLALARRQTLFEPPPGASPQPEQAARARSRFKRISRMRARWLPCCRRRRARLGRSDA